MHKISISYVFHANTFHYITVYHFISPQWLNNTIRKVTDNAALEKKRKKTKLSKCYELLLVRSVQWTGTPIHLTTSAPLPVGHPGPRLARLLHRIYLFAQAFRSNPRPAIFTSISTSLILVTTPQESNDPSPSPSRLNQGKKL